MGLMTSYLITTKNLHDFLNAITTARAPERFTQQFLQQLEFKSSNDRLFIGVLKGLGFLDESSVPTQKYYNFLDQTQSGVVLANAIEEAYSDLFSLNKNAQDMSVEEVKNKFRSLTQGQKSDNVINLMANTFKSLCDYADWDKSATVIQETEETPKEDTGETIPKQDETNRVSDKERVSPTLHYNIQIHLPETRDPAVFDAIFKSLKQHLM